MQKMYYMEISMYKRVELTVGIAARKSEAEMNTVCPKKEMLFNGTVPCNGSQSNELLIRIIHFQFIV